MNLLYRRLITSLIPFVFGYSASLLKRQASQNSWFDRFGLDSSYFAFLLMMIILETLMEVAQRAIASRNNFDDESKGLYPSSFEKQGKNLKTSLKALLHSIACFTLIFFVYQAFGLWIISLLGNRTSLNDYPPLTMITEEQDSIAFTSQEQMINPNQERNFLTTRGRVLEEEKRLSEENNQQQKGSSQILQRETLSFSMGNLISDSDFRFSVITLTRDQKLIFGVTEGNAGLELNVFDISDVKSPRLIGRPMTLKLPKYSISFVEIQAIVLSSDEKTLFISSFAQFAIVNVTDPEAPELIFQKTWDKVLNLRLTKNFKNSLEIDESGKILFLGGQGLLAYNISDLAQPTLLKNFTTIWNPKFDDNFHMDEIKLSPDKKFLLQVDKDLKIYNISDPKDIRLITVLETPCSAGSLRFTSNPNRLLLLGYSAKGINIDEVDVSNYSSPSIIKSYQFDYTKVRYPHFVASSPGQTRYFIGGFSEPVFRSGLLTFDDITKTMTTNSEDLVKDMIQVEFLQGGKYILTTSFSTATIGFRITELRKDYSNFENFESTIRIANKFSLTSKDLVQMEISPDGKTMFFAYESIATAVPSASFEIWETSDINIPSKLSLLDTTKYCQGVGQTPNRFMAMSFAPDYKTVYLLFAKYILFVDISDRSSPKVIKRVQGEAGGSMQNLHRLLMMPDMKNGVGLIGDSVATFDFSEDAKDFKRIWTSNKKSRAGFQALLKDDETLIIAGNQLTIYNISNIQSPVEIVSVPINKNKIDPMITAAHLSSEKNTLYLQVFDGSGEPLRLQIYNISDLSSPQLMAEHTVYKTKKINYANSGRFFMFDSDFNTGFLLQNGYLLKTQLSNGKISGVIPHYNNIDEPIEDFRLSPSGHTIYARTKSDPKTISILTAHPNHTLYLNKEKISLGERYSENVKILRLNKIFDYDLLSDANSYKILKLSLLEVKFDPNNYSPDFIESPLPSWIQFDPNRKIITFEPKHHKDLGNYTFQSSMALQIPDSAFDSLGVDSEDLLVWLTALNYVDNQLFLAENFVSLESVYASGGGLGKFRLPKEFRPYKDRIFQILREYYIKVATTFEVIPTLELGQNLVISTPQSENIKVNIDLTSHSEAQAQFLHKSYAPISSVFIENKPKPRFQFEGTLNNINAALQSIVVDFEKNQDFGANFTINDGLNKPLTVSFTNASKLFSPNTFPEISNRSIQQQINLHDIFTGQHFTIDFDQNTFKDDWTDTLSYELRSANPKIDLPKWLSLTDLKLQGNPPEDIIKDIDLIIIAKNEFKETREAFKIQVKISLVFYLKLALKYGSYLLSIVGLLISLNKIFNILGKRFYRHPQEYTLSPGEKITPEVLPPIYFVLKEKQEAKLIIKHLERFVSTELKLKSVKFLDYFISSASKQLDKQKIFDTIETSLENLPLKDRGDLSCYCSVKNSRKALIQQLIIDQLTVWQLAQDKKTKSIFNSIKKKWTEMVRWDASLSKFVLNQGKFDKIVQEKLHSASSSSEKECLLGDLALEDSVLLVSGVNLGLLENAILAYAFDEHQINRLPVRTKVTMKEQIKTNFIKRFFKRDLQITHKINYGVNYEITDDILTFSGTTKANLEGRTLVIQIESHRERILKEIWIRGALPSSQIHQGDVYDQHNNYEIY